MENTSDSFMPGPLLFCMKIERSVCYKVTDNNLNRVERALGRDTVKTIVQREKSVEGAQRIQNQERKRKIDRGGR